MKVANAIDTKYENNFFHAYNNLGSIQLETNDLDSAIKNFKKSIELNELFTPGHRNLSLVKKYTKEDKHFQKLITPNWLWELIQDTLLSLLNTTHTPIDHSLDNCSHRHPY